MNVLLALWIVNQSGIPESGYGLTVKPMVDYDAGLVYYEEWVDSLYLGTAAVQRFDDYLVNFGRELALEGFKTRLSERQTIEEAGGVVGIIPNIKLEVAGERTDIAVDGQDRITLGVTQTYLKDTTQSDNQPPGVIFQQDLSVSVKGTIARKTEVTLNHTSGASGLFDEGENKVNLKYTGDEDEIVKKIEAGDVALNLGHTRQMLPSSQGLFGINAQTKLGPVDIYAVAAREQTKSTTLSFVGNTQLQTGEIEDRSFTDKKFFMVFHDSLPESLNTVDFNTQFPGFHLYVSEQNPSGRIRHGNAFPNPNDSTFRSSEIDRGRTYVLLNRGQDYNLIPDPRFGWIIAMISSLGDNQVLAVACTTSTGYVLGKYDSSRDSVDLLLVWGQDPDTSSIVWTNMLRNRYSLGGGTGSDYITLTIKQLKGGQWRDRDSLTGLLYSQILGLTDSTSQHAFTSEEKDLGGVLIFPDRYPYTNPKLDTDTNKTRLIYWTRNVGNNPDVGGIFSIGYEYETQVKSFYIGPFVKEKSVRVFLNGKELGESDFTVYYDEGEVRLNVIITPTDKIDITFEEKEIMSMDRKSLLGLRAESELIEGVRLGSSILFRSVGYSAGSKPILGMAPYSNTVGEVDLSAERKIPFITRVIDKLPLVSTEAASVINLTFNSSISMPNPNTNRSGAVWVEDFEGTQENQSVGISSTELGNWYITSLPLREGISPLDTALFSHNRPIWRTRSMLDYRRDIFGEEITSSGTNLEDYKIDIPRITWTPAQNEDTTYWTGIIGGSDSRTLDLTQAENMELIIKTYGTKGKIHFDFGSSIDEDQLRRNVEGEFAGLYTFNTEQKDLDLALSDVENTGLDGVMGNDSLPRDSLEALGDDGNDDWNERLNPNGTEGNSRLDSEDLLGKGFMRTNAYYEFTLDLNDPVLLSKYVNTIGDSGWIRVSVPVPRKDTILYKRLGGDPDGKNIALFRIWFEGMNDPCTLEVYHWVFAGNKWRDPTVLSVVSDTVDTTKEKIYIDVIGTENKDYKTAWERTEDPLTGGLEQDHSLQMRYENIDIYHQLKVARWDYDPEDFRAYHRLRIYVRDSTNNPQFYLRVGTDEANYYEMRKRIRDGEIPQGSEDSWWREFEFNLDTLAILKKENYSILKDDSAGVVVVSSDSSLFVCGKPTFAQIKYYALGIINDSNDAITGEVWFNDIRLVGVEKSIGTNLSMSGTLKLADLATVTSRYNQDRGGFTNFITKPGPRTTGQSSLFDVSGSLNLHKFGLDKLGFSLPVNAGWTLSRSKPRYSGEISDYVLPESELEDIKEESDGRRLDFSISHSRSKSKLLQYTLDGLNASANYTWGKSHSNAGLAKDSSYKQNYAVSYQSNPDLSFNLGKTKISYFPRLLDFGAHFDKSLLNSYSRLSVADTLWNSTNPRNTSLNWDARLGYDPIKYLPLSAGYSETRARNSALSINSLISSPYVLRNLSLSSNLSSISFKSFGSPSASLSTSFIDDHSYPIYEQLRAINGGDIISDSLNAIVARARNLSNSRNLTLSWRAFDPNGILLSGKKKVEEKASDERLLLGNNPDSLGNSARPVPDSLEPDTIVEKGGYTDSIPRDTLTDTLNKPPTSRRLVRLERSLKILEVLGKATKIFKPIEIVASFSNNSSYNYHIDPTFNMRDDWRYVIGLSDRLNESPSASMSTVPFSKQWRGSYSLKSGLYLFGVSIDGSIKRDSTTFVPAILRDTGYQKDWILPAISASYSNLAELFKKVKIISSSQLSSSFSYTISEKGYRDTVMHITERISKTGNKLITDTTWSVATQISREIKLTPLVSWSTTWQGRVTSNVSVDYSVRYDTTSPGSADSINTTTTITGGSASVGYTFSKPSGFKIPFLKHLKFKNDLNLTLTGTYNQTRTVSSTQPDKKDKITNISALLQGTYTFSEAFDGGFDFKFTNTENALSSSLDRNTVDFDLFVVFKF